MSNAQQNNTVFPGISGISSNIKCEAPLIPWIPLDDKLSVSAKEQISSSRLCFKNCCYPCDRYMNIPDNMKRLETATITLESIVFVLSFLTLVNYLIVSPKLLVNSFAGIQSLAFMILTTALSVGQINVGYEDRCSDPITPIDGYGSHRCMAQGVFYVLGSHLMNLALTFRILAVLMRIVWGKSVQKRYIMILGGVISGLFAGIVSRYVSYQGGIFCSPDPEREISMVKVPGLVYSVSGLLILIGLSCYVSNTLYHISLNVTRSKKLANHGDDIEFSAKVKLGALAYLRSVRLLWRTYVCASFLTTLVACGLLFIFSKTGESHQPRELPVSAWLRCIQEDLDAKACIGESIKFGEYFYKEKLISIIVIAIQLIIFIVTESRLIIFRVWFNILKSPLLLITKRKELNQMIDELLKSSEASNKNATDDAFQRAGMSSLSEPDNGQLNWFSRYKEAKEFRDFEQQLANHRRMMSDSDHYQQQLQQQDASNSNTMYHNSSSTSESKSDRGKTMNNPTTTVYDNKEVIDPITTTATAMITPAHTPTTQLSINDDYDDNNNNNEVNDINNDNDNDTTNNMDIIQFLKSE